MTVTHCLRCKKETQTNGAKMALSSNGRRMLKGTCATCGSAKSSFVSGSAKAPAKKGGKKKGAGFLDWLL